MGLKTSWLFTSLVTEGKSGALATRLLSNDRRTKGHFRVAVSPRFINYPSKNTHMEITSICVRKRAHGTNLYLNSLMK